MLSESLPLSTLILIVLAGGFWWWRLHRQPTQAGQLALYGNVDLREVNLAFNGSQRIASIYVEEGDG